MPLSDVSRLLFKYRRAAGAAGPQCALNDQRVDAKRDRRGFVMLANVGNSQRLAALQRCSTVCAHAAPNKLGEAAAPIPKKQADYLLDQRRRS